MTDGLSWLRPYMRLPAPRVAASAARLTRADLARALGHDPDENEREFLAERSAIRCFDGGQSLEDAEHGALADLLRIMERERQARHA